ncbi:hypothetical protein Z517_05069 [Fonsecaea pedrosoi CBS 271.37]|uniref:Uncharacterized protein n=1 Tax=Fonsecaea pedrosoi CBS 271.37 TaxID=1442368 RepID=A0A0D2F5U9_9EURO|nr:uncharacterized protein Z517_05069 [Fonsecaea pedrosoi CBS 271.37]KIW82042.1 hypothetical protein Z517_05069 [Fonsecaea pedrosoi CBS 271.37]
MSETELPPSLVDDEGNFPTIPTNPEDENPDRTFGATASKLLRANPKIKDSKGKPLSDSFKDVDPRSLPGAFFFMKVTPKKKEGSSKEPELKGQFDALAYDPYFSFEENTDAIKKRYLEQPPYLENLTNRDTKDNFVSVEGDRNALSGLFGANPTAYSKTDWYFDQPIQLTLAFKANNWGHGNPVGFAWTSGSAQTIEIDKTSPTHQFRRLFRRKAEWRYGFQANVDKFTDHVYLVEYYTVPVNPVKWT